MLFIDIFKEKNRQFRNDLIDFNNNIYAEI